MEANNWKDVDTLKRIQKACAVLECLGVAKKEDYKTLTKALSDAFGEDENGKHLAKEDIQVFAYYLEVLLRHAMLIMEKGDGGMLLTQQFVQGASIELKKQLLQRPTLSHEKTVAVAQQLDLAGQISPNPIGQVNEGNTSGGAEPAMASLLLVTQLMANIDTPTRKVSESSQSVANINATSTRGSFRRQRNPCYQCVHTGHIASECRGPKNTSRQANHRQRETENYCFVCGMSTFRARMSGLVPVSC